MQAEAELPTLSMWDAPDIPMFRRVSHVLVCGVSARPPLFMAARLRQAAGAARPRWKTTPGKRRAVEERCTGAIRLHEYCLGKSRPNLVQIPTPHPPSTHPPTQDAADNITKPG